MRILIASGTWDPERGGVARVATEVARKLALRGHTVTALVPRTAELPDEERAGSLTVHRVIERGRIPLTITDVLETTRHADGRGQVDVLLAHGFMAAVGLSRVPLSAPLVLVYHASLSRELGFMRPRLHWGRERLATYVNKPIASVLERTAARRSGRILVLSEYSKSLLATDHPADVGKVRMVSGGVDTNSFCPADGKHAARARLELDRAKRLLVTVRRAEPRMGLEQLLLALRVLEDDVALAVVGGGLLSDDLRRLSDELGLGHRVRFVGLVPDDELHDWYRAADLFVLPTVAYEGFGMVTAEALATGTPVVGTPVGATPELLEPLDPRLLSEGTNPDSLAAAIREGFAFIDERFRARCREYAVARFDWDEVIVGWEDALLEVVRDGETLGAHADSR
jgi:glycosyltransferase involved in cell wall biosynthesis